MGRTAAPHAPAVLHRDDVTRDSITASLRAHNDLIYDFATAWYRSPYTFRSTRVLGYPACKIPLDLWVLHDLFCQYRFSRVVETGTAGGGTTLWYAMLMEMLGIEDGRVLSVDVDPAEAYGVRPQHPRIEYVTGSSTDPALVADVAARFLDPALPTLVNLDSDHHAPHVLRELELWAPLVPVNGWLVVEDTNGSPVDTHPETGLPVMVEGPLAGVMEYLERHPGEFTREVVCERYWLTMNPHGWLQRARPHEDAR